MPHLIYYVAATEDGYIAGPGGDLGWLQAYERPDEDYGYGSFVESVDGLVMGRATYEVVQTLGSDWPYGGRPAWVCRHDGDTPAGAPAGVRYTREDPAALRRRWRALGLHRIWLVGGGRLARAFLDAGMLDELLITRVPVRLGEGIGLFGPGEAGTQVPPGWGRVAQSPLAHGLSQECWRPLPA